MFSEVMRLELLTGLVSWQDETRELALSLYHVNISLPCEYTVEKVAICMSWNHQSPPCWHLHLRLPGSGNEGDRFLLCEPPG